MRQWASISLSERSTQFVWEHGVKLSLTPLLKSLNCSSLISETGREMSERKRIFPRHTFLDAFIFFKLLATKRCVHTCCTRSSGMLKIENFETKFLKMQSDAFFLSHSENFAILLPNDALSPCAAKIFEVEVRGLVRHRKIFELRETILFFRRPASDN